MQLLDSAAYTVCLGVLLMPQILLSHIFTTLNLMLRHLPHLLLPAFGCLCLAVHKGKLNTVHNYFIAVPLCNMEITQLYQEI